MIQLVSLFFELYTDLVILAWKSKANKKHRYKQTFTLQTSPGLPQSKLDKTIFHSDWRLRAGWEWSERKGKNDKPMIFFYRGDRGMQSGHSDYDLAVERSREFKREYKGGQWCYVPAERTWEGRRNPTMFGSGEEWGYR